MKQDKRFLKDIEASKVLVSDSGGLFSGTTAEDVFSENRALINSSESTLTGHTGDTSIHFTQGSISITESQISDLGDYSLTGHTHVIADITDFTDNSSQWNTSYDDSVTGMTVSGSGTKTITLTQRDGSVITANFTDNVGGSGGGDSFTGVTFDTGTGDLDITSTGSTLNVNLDGRYSLTGHTHTVSDITDFPTNISTFTNDVGYLTGATGGNDTFVSGASFNTGDGIIEFTNTTGGTFNTNLDNRYLKIDGSDVVTGNVTVSTDGSSKANPRTLGFTGLTTGEAMAVDFGDVYNSLRSGFGDGTILYSYHTLYFKGGTQNSTSGQNTETDAPNDSQRAEVHIITIPNRSISFRGAASQSADIVKFENNAKDTLSGVDSLGRFFGDGSRLTGITGATGGVSESVTGSTFNTSTGDLTLTTNSGTTIVTSLDNRYSLTGHTHTASEITDFDTEVSNNADVTANTAKTGITETQASDIITNNAKVGVTVEEENTINSLTAGEPSGSDVVLNVVSLTQAEYNAASASTVSTTLYIING